MPLEEKEIQEIEERVRKSILGSDQIGMIARHAREASEKAERAAEKKATELLEKAKGETKPAGETKPIEGAKTESDEVSKVRAEMTAMQTKIVAKEKRTEILAAAADWAAKTGKRFFDVEEDVVDKIRNKVHQRDDGSFFVEIKNKLPETGEEIREEISIAEAVARLTVERPYLVRGVVIDSSGAKSGAVGSAPRTEPKTYAELMADPKAVGYWAKTKPELIDRLRAENDAALRESRLAAKRR